MNSLIRTRNFISLLLFLLLSCCGGKSKSYQYEIALDASWYSLEAPGRSTNLTAFTAELIEAIGKIERTSIAVYRRSWNNLMYGLQDNEYNAICSTLQPYLFYEKLYDFSDLFLMTGPVLVTPAKGPAQTLDKMSGKIIGIVQGSNSALILEKYPNIIQRTYAALQDALNDTSQGAIDGTMADILTAEAFTRDLFQGRLKISTPPLTQQGVRIVAVRGRSGELIRIFNRGLKRLKDNGTYSKLAKKWNLAEPIAK
jgi:polar amino acid transport system substrate-binding protein